MMKNIISSLMVLFSVMTMTAREYVPRVVVHDMDGDGVADTVRIDPNDLLLVCALSSQDFHSVSSYTYKPNLLLLQYNLEPADNGFKLSRDSHGETLYRDEYIFTYNPDLRRMELSKINLKYTEYEMQLPGIAGTVLYHECNLNYDLQGGNVSMDYSDGNERHIREFGIDHRAVVPFKYFSFDQLPGSLIPLKHGLSWVIMDELYPVEQRTPEFIYALPVDPRTPHLIVHDIDGDSLCDTVRIQKNTDDWTVWIECLLSSRDFSPVNSQALSLNPRYSGLKPINGGFAVCIDNTDSDTHQTFVNAFTYDRASGKMFFSYSSTKDPLYHITLPGRIYGIYFEDAEDHVYLLQGRYILNYTEKGKQLSREYTAQPLIISLEEFLYEDHYRKIGELFDGYRQAILDEMNFPARRAEPEWADMTRSDAVRADYLELYMDDDDIPDTVRIDRVDRVMTIQLSGDDTALFSIDLFNRKASIVGNHGKTLVIEIPYYYYSFDYSPEYREILLSCVYSGADKGEPQYHNLEKVYYPQEGFVQNVTKTYMGIMDKATFDEDSYRELWETREVEPLLIQFDGFDFKKINSLINHVHRELIDVRNSPIEIPDELLQ